MTLSLIRTAPSAMSLVKAIAETRGYSADDLRGRSKLASISRLRKRAYLALEEQKGWSQSQIGRLFRRDRSQVCRGSFLPDVSVHLKRLQRLTLNTSKNWKRRCAGYRV